MSQFKKKDRSLKKKRSLLYSWSRKRFSEAYERSPLFRKIVNFFGITAGSGVVALSSTGACPCCGQSAAACPLGLIGAVVIGFFVGVLYLLLDFLRKVWKLLFLEFNRSFQYLKSILSGRR